jgi:hypothetical protein
MKDKYLNKEGITEKYDFKSKKINCVEWIGILGGLGYAVAHMGYDFSTKMNLDIKGVKDLGIGVGVALVSWIGGDYISKRNEKKKEKALRNLEERTSN